MIIKNVHRNYSSFGTMTIISRNLMNAEFVIASFDRRTYRLHVSTPLKTHSLATGQCFRIAFQSFYSPPARLSDGQ